MSMTAGLSDTAKVYNKKAFHRRNDSDELDVFEAARYFSGYNEAIGYNNGATYTTTQKVDRKYSWRGGRMSLDVPMRNPLPQQITMEKQILKEKKKYKQPSSPGGRLASFLNSLFNQTSSKKKKSKPTTQSLKDEDESPGGRRKRRSSISHFRCSSTTTDTKSLYSSSSSGFRTPPAYAHTPTKSYKDLRSFSDHKQMFSFSKYNIGNVKSSSRNEVLDARRYQDLAFCEEKFKLNHDNHRCLGKDRNWVDQFPSEEKEYRKFNEVDDGAESDSSSDLFELQNYDLGIYSSDPPVYETTNMDSIKRGAPISNGTL